MSPAAKPVVERSTSSDAKKKRSSGSSSNPAGAAALNAVSMTSTAMSVSMETLYKDITNLEELESRNRSPERDAKCFLDTTDEIKKLMKQMLTLRLKKAPVKDLTEVRNKASMHILTLKKLNRLDKIRTRSARDGTNEAKQKVDSLHLKLQNLLYEVLHLQKEITKCQQYRSGDEDIDLVPLEEFYDNAPAEVAKAEETKANPHQLYLARLEYENLQRLDMTNSFKKFEAKQDALERIISEKKTKLESLRPQLQQILEVTKPVQSYLSMPISEQYELVEMAKYLPKPLFLLFSETRAFATARKIDVKVDLEGDLEEAKNFTTTCGESDNDDDAQRDDNTEEEETVKKKRSSKGGKKILSRQEQMLQKMLTLHPLKVTTDIGHSELGDTRVFITFSYLPRLQVVTAKPKLVLGTQNRTAAADQEVLQQANLLAHLLSKDSGLESPNPTTKYVLSQIGMSNIPLNALEEIGYFYQWAQSLSGVVFPDAALTDGSVVQELVVSPKQQVCEDKVHDIIMAIQQRIQSRVTLQRQLSHLEKAKVLPVELQIPESVQHLFPSTGANSRIRNWTPVHWEDYNQVEITKHLVHANCVDGDDFFYRLQINREPATLIALIAIKPDYPARNPIFCLNLHWGKNEYNLANCENVRALERFVNQGFSSEETPSSVRGEMLTLQLQRLLTSLDALLEAWNLSIEPNGAKVDFKKEKMFLRATSGRARSLPLIFKPSIQLFTHY